MGAVVSEGEKYEEDVSATVKSKTGAKRVKATKKKVLVAMPEMKLKRFSVSQSDSLELVMPFFDSGMLFALASAFPEHSDLFIIKFLQSQGKSPFEGAPYRSAASTSGVFGTFRQEWGNQFHRCVDSKTKPEYDILESLIHFGKLTKAPTWDVLMANHHVKEMEEEADLEDKQVQVSTEEKKDGMDEFDEPKKEALKKAWGKGVGYGSEYTSDDAEWDILRYKEECLKNEEAITNCLVSIRSFLTSDSEAIKIISQSCVLPALITLCQNDSFQEIEAKSPLYSAVFKLIQSIVQIPEMIPFIFEGDDCSLAAKIWQLGIQAEAMENLKSKLSKDKVVESDDVGAILVKTYRAVKESLNLCITMLSVAQKLTGDKTDLTSLLNKLNDRKEHLANSYVFSQPKKNLNLESEYEAMMRDTCFDSIEEVSEFGTHHYLNYEQNKKVSRKLLKRLAAEFSDLPSSLPIHYESSVLFRFCEERMNVAQMLVVPPDGTPYGGGCFIFDILFPSNYPAVPPKVNLATTGKGSVRFNPNLYESGYVCLSLLGTWDAYTQGEEWNPGLSTLLQVIISVQSLIFVPEPYYNEPGFEADMGTEYGDKQSKSYNLNIQRGTAQWAMIDMLENPTPAWKDVIYDHFRMQGDRVLRNVREWFGPGAPQVVKLEKLIANLSVESDSDSNNKNLIAKNGA